MMGVLPGIQFDMSNPIGDAEVLLPHSIVDFPFDAMPEVERFR
jgi:hypothetical protein